MRCTESVTDGSGLAAPRTREFTGRFDPTWPTLLAEGDPALPPQQDFSISSSAVQSGRDLIQQIPNAAIWSWYQTTRDVNTAVVVQGDEVVLRYLRTVRNFNVSSEIRCDR